LLASGGRRLDERRKIGSAARSLVEQMPNTLVRDQQITVPPINGSYNARDRDYWRPSTPMATAAPARRRHLAAIPARASPASAQKGVTC
jgi:hypothetical protein